MTTPSVFGNHVSGYQIRQAVETNIKTWIRDYLGEAAVSSGFNRNDVPPYTSYVGTTTLDHFSEELIPSCLILTPGISKSVRRGGKWDLTWTIAVVSIVASIDRDAVLRLSETYALALRMLMLQKPSQGGVATSTEFVTERYDELDGNDKRTIAAAYSHFEITVEGAVERGGPTTPSDPSIPVTDPGSWPDVMSVDISERSV